MKNLIYWEIPRTKEDLARLIKIGALNSAVYKWEQVKKGLKGDTGSHDCALCRQYQVNSEEDCFEKMCFKCPVARRTERSGCFGTVYIYWQSHQIRKHKRSLKLCVAPAYVQCQECITIARDMFFFLRMVRADVLGNGDPKRFVRYYFLETQYRHMWE